MRHAMLRRPATFAVPSYFIAASTLMLTACGDCPSSRLEPARPERTESLLIEAHADGTVTESIDGDVAFERACDTRCRTAFQDPSTSCEAACDAMDNTGGEVQTCAFNPDRTSLTCELHFPARAEQCNCSIVDC